MFECRTESCLVSGLSILQSLLEYKRHWYVLSRSILFFDIAFRFYLICSFIYSLSINIQQLPTPQSNIQQTSEFDGMPQCYAQQIIGRDMMSSENITSLDTERLAKGVRQVQAAIVPRLQDFTYLLLNPPHRDPIRTTVGIINKPLGATRLEVAHLFTALLSTNNLEIMEKLSELNTLSVLIVSVFV